MNQKELLTKVMSLVLEINAETEYKASMSLFPDFIVVKVEDKKQFIAEELHKSIQTIAGSSYDEKRLKTKMDEFFAYGLELIEEQNPATYKRIKDQY